MSAKVLRGSLRTRPLRPSRPTQNQILRARCPTDAARTPSQATLSTSKVHEGAWNIKFTLVLNFTLLKGHFREMFWKFPKFLRTDTLTLRDWWKEFCLASAFLRLALFQRIYSQNHCKFNNNQNCTLLFQNTVMLFLICTSDFAQIYLCNAHLTCITSDKSLNPLIVQQRFDLS